MRTRALGSDPEAVASLLLTVRCLSGWLSAACRRRWKIVILCRFVVCCPSLTLKVLLPIPVPAVLRCRGAADHCPPPCALSLPKTPRLLAGLNPAHRDLALSLPGAGRDYGPTLAAEPWRRSGRVPRRLVLPPPGAPLRSPSRALAGLTTVSVFSAGAGGARVDRLAHRAAVRRLLRRHHPRATRGPPRPEPPTRWAPASSAT